MEESPAVRRGRHEGGGGPVLPVQGAGGLQEAGGQYRLLARRAAAAGPVSREGDAGEQGADGEQAQLSPGSAPFPPS